MLQRLDSLTGGRDAVIGGSTKLEPLHLDPLLLYARGQCRRANLFTDTLFGPLEPAAWNHGFGDCAKRLAQENQSPKA